MSCERRESATRFSPTETAHAANPTPNDRAEATGEMRNEDGVRSRGTLAARALVNHHPPNLSASGNLQEIETLLVGSDGVG